MKEPTVPSKPPLKRENPKTVWHVPIGRKIRFFSKCAFGAHIPPVGNFKTVFNQFYKMIVYALQEVIVYLNFLSYVSNGFWILSNSREVLKAPAAFGRQLLPLSFADAASNRTVPLSVGFPH
jgi:hypothetical protein